MKKTTLLLLVACLLAVGGCASSSGRTEATPEKSSAPDVATAEKSVAVTNPDEGKRLPIEGTRAGIAAWPLSALREQEPILNMYPWS